MSTLGSFVTEFCAKLSVSFDFLLQNSPGLSSFFPPALPCLYFCLKLGCLPISTSIYVAFTPHETAPAGLRNYLATKPRASPPHLPLNTVQFSWTWGGAVRISGGVCGGKCGGGGWGLGGGWRGRWSQARWSWAANWRPALPISPSPNCRNIRLRITPRHETTRLPRMTPPQARFPR